MQSHSFLSRVRRKLPDLHPAERRLGDLICDFPGEVASYSASELAALAGVSNATVSRFVKRLGYASYEDARRDARTESSSGSRLYTRQTGTEPAAAPDSFIETDIRNVRESLEGIDRAAIDALAARILDARKVWCVGYRASNPLASYLCWQLLQVVDEAVPVPGGGQTMGEHVARMGPDDLVIAFGLRRRIAAFGGLLDAIRGTGAQVALITDEGAPEDRQVDWHFRCETRSSGPLFSHVGVMALLNLVTNRTIELADDSGRQRLQAIESMNDLLNEL
ncbi:MurR/RpiR family transcriptional regulator [Mangrovicoccus sp. HB161399]|uniref:MurR/RpiR family transcriptional regulator n=1 Tax=Mangrovicoccus sp. HB161399 TaxID=2720392 RepID=UPI00155826A8|nr:MurR/RpiR family transcriptional regulator [Mangrovicoccus sp. HB161399]